MSNRGRLILVVLFFGGLTALWLAERFRVPTARERLERDTHVLPELLDVAVPDVGRVEIKGGEKTISLERHGREWRLTEPVEARADGTSVDLLIETLRGLRKPADAEPLEGDLKEFGLEPPERVVTVFGKDGKKALATVEVGKEYGANRYVRKQGETSAELEDALLLKTVDLPVNDWRDPLLFDVGSYGVSGFEVTGQGRTVQAERLGKGRQAWRLTEPVRAPGDALKLEGMVGGLTSMRVAEKDKGFVENDVKDLKKYGLDEPAWRVALRTEAGTETVEIGAEEPGEKARFYARRVPEDDVVAIPGQVVVDLEMDPHLLRSKQVAMLEPSKLDFVRVKAGETVHEMRRTEEGWRLESPFEGPADALRVENLLSLLNRLQVVEFFDPKEVRNTGLKAPESVISVWESSGGTPGGKTPTLRLEVGRRNRVGRVLYAHEAGDPAVLALPVDVLEGDFRNRFAFVEHRMTEDEPGTMTSLERSGPVLAERIEAPENPKDYAAWTMTEPVKAKADRESVAMVDHLLNPLRADRMFERGGTPDLGAYGLDEPWVRIAWTVKDGSGEEKKHVLRIGAEAPEGKGARYAWIEGGSTIFSLDDLAARVATIELHERRVLDFAPTSVRRLTIRRPTGQKVFRHTTKPFTGGLEWTPAPGTLVEDVDVTQMDRLVGELAALRVERFVQFEGDFPDEAGLDAPALTFELELRGGQGVKRLRIGAKAGQESRYATVEETASGVVFLIPDLPRMPWTRLLRRGQAEGVRELPEELFAPGGGE